ncbi:MAG TPA: PaaI family thioesterase [Gaiellaceae bacterium]|nr:PaaI family thioesterase [Gaiellaceae bacterium]
MKPLDNFRAMIAGDAEPPPVAKLIGFAMTEVEPGRAVFEMDAGPQHASPLGTMHGGVICDLVDGAMGVAHAATLEDGETFTTLELKINFMKPVWSGHLRAEGTVIKAGRTIGLVEGRVTDESGSLVAFATATCLTLRGDAAEGR